jgi:hypothetical protein
MPLQLSRILDGLRLQVLEPVVNASVCFVVTEVTSKFFSVLTSWDSRVDVVEVEQVPQFKRLIRPSDVEAMRACKFECSRVVRLGKTVPVEHTPHIAIGSSLSGRSRHQVYGFLDKTVRVESCANRNHLGSLTVDWKGLKVVAGAFLILADDENSASGKNVRTSPTRAALPGFVTGHDG